MDPAAPDMGSPRCGKLSLGTDLDHSVILGLLEVPRDLIYLSQAQSPSQYHADKANSFLLMVTDKKFWRGFFAQSQKKVSFALSINPTPGITLGCSVASFSKDKGFTKSELLGGSITQTGKLRHGDMNTAVKEPFFQFYSHICSWVSQEPVFTAWFL